MRLKPIIQEKTQENREKNQGRPDTKKLRQKSDTVKIRTDKELAKLAGVSHDTIYKAEIIKNEVKTVTIA